MIIKIESLTTKGKYYEVDTMALTCTCPAYTNRKRFGKDFCKHISLVLEQKAKENSPELLGQMNWQHSKPDDVRDGLKAQDEKVKAVKMLLRKV